MTPIWIFCFLILRIEYTISEHFEYLCICCGSEPTKSRNFPSTFWWPLEIMLADEWMRGLLLLLLPLLLSLLMDAVLGACKNSVFFHCSYQGWNGEAMSWAHVFPKLRTVRSHVHLSFQTHTWPTIPQSYSIKVSIYIKTVSRCFFHTYRITIQDVLANVQRTTFFKENLNIRVVEISSNAKHRNVTYVWPMVQVPTRWCRGWVNQQPEASQNGGKSRRTMAVVRCESLEMSHLTAWVAQHDSNICWSRYAPIPCCSLCVLAVWIPTLLDVCWKNPIEWRALTLKSPYLTDVNSI